MAIDPNLLDDITEMMNDKKTYHDKHEQIIFSSRQYLSVVMEQHRFKDAQKFLIQMPVQDIASMLSGIDEPQKSILFRLLPQDLSADVFSEFSNNEQEELLETLSNNQVKNILEEMDPDDRTDLLEELPAMVVKKLLHLMSEDKRKVASKLLNYAEDTAGRHMTTDYMDLRDEMTVTEALDYIRTHASKKETIYTCYVLDKKGVLVGSVSLEDIILSPAKKHVVDICNKDFIFVRSNTKTEDIIKTIKHYDLLAVPVVDIKKKLIGIITEDDVIDWIEEESTEDFHRFAAVHPMENGYLQTPFMDLLVHRSIWLVILLMIGSFSQDILKIYSTSLESIWIPLSLFFTVLVGIGGNVGSQSTVLVIRGLATGEITDRDTWKLIGRSVTMGLAMGLLLSFMLLLRIALFHTGGEVKWIVTAALAMIIFLANILGALLPLVLKKLGMDPAIISGPMITTIVDLGGIWIYFEIAKFFLGI